MQQWNKPDFSDPRLEKARVFATVAHAAVGQKRKYTGEPYIVHPVECVAILQSLPPESGVTVQQLIAMVLHDTVEDTRKYVDEDDHVITKTGTFVKTGRKLFLVEGISFDLVRAEFSFGDPAFGDDVVRILSGLTDVSMPWDGNRSARKGLDLAHTAEQSPDVKTNKLADLISNAPSIIEHDPGFARKWMGEKQALLDVLQDGGDPILFDIAREIMTTYLKGRHNYG